jgi:predicted nucleic acid-binding protein
VTRFLDTNILVYAHQAHPKGAQAQAVLVEGGLISVQVLNEFTNVLRKKLRRSWTDIEAALVDVACILPAPRPLTAETHAYAVGISRDLGYSFYDSLILASAIESGCDTVLTEDMQDGHVIGPVTIRNPFS